MAQCVRLVWLQQALKLHAGASTSVPDMPDLDDELSGAYIWVYVVHLLSLYQARGNSHLAMAGLRSQLL